MGELIVSLIVASIIGHQIDEAKVKKYEMVKHNGEVVKVQFSKKKRLLLSDVLQFRAFSLCKRIRS